MKPSEVLAKAADLIEPEGRWCQKAYHSGEARCAVGAIVHIGEQNGGHQSATTEIFIRAICPDFAISTWNDREGRTQAEVVSALRKASELARSEGQ